MPQPITKDEVSAAILTVKAVADTIRELGEVPSGVLYAQVMSKLPLNTYDRIIGILINANLVKLSGHVLTWVGPK